MAQLLGYIFGGLVLLGAGVGIGYWLALNGRDRGKAEAIQAEFDEYRRQVGSHFEQTAQHFRTIGREYRSLYDHMASGAEQLCETRATDERLSFDPHPGPTPPGESPQVVDPPQVAAEDSEPAEAESQPETVIEESVSAVDESTPETRARAAGGESAPAEEQEELPDEPEESVVEAAGEPEDAAAQDDADAEEKAPEAPKAEGATDDKDRIYH